MDSFPIAPATAKWPLWMLPVLLALVVTAVAGLVGRSLLASRTARFTLSSDGLRLEGDWYGRTIPAAQLRGGEARRVDFAEEPDLRPRWRTMGTGLPGYQAGWFRLRNGERALLYLTDRSRAVYIPTTAGYSLLLSPADPETFLSTLRGAAR